MASIFGGGIKEKGGAGTRGLRCRLAVLVCLPAQERRNIQQLFFSFGGFNPLSRIQCGGLGVAARRRGGGLRPGCRRCCWCRPGLSGQARLLLAGRAQAWLGGPGGIHCGCCRLKRLGGTGNPGEEALRGLAVEHGFWCATGPACVCQIRFRKWLQLSVCLVEAQGLAFRLHRRRRSKEALLAPRGRGRSLDLCCLG